MPRHSRHDLLAPPAALLSALGEARPTWRHEGLRSYGHAGELFARYSADPNDAPAYAYERAVRDEINGTPHGVLRAPRVVAYGDQWMVEEAVTSIPVSGTEAMQLIASAANEVATLVLPPRPAGAPTARLSDGATRLRHAAALVRHPRLAVDFWRSAAAVREADVGRAAGHRDFHLGNVFPGIGSVWVFDWELSGESAVGGDAMRFWCCVADRSDRAALFEATVSILGEEHRAGLQAVLYATAVRTLIGAAFNPQPFDRDPDLARQLGALIPEVRVAAARETRLRPRENTRPRE